MQECLIDVALSLLIFPTFSFEMLDKSPRSHMPLQQFLSKLPVVSTEILYVLCVCRCYFMRVNVVDFNDDRCCFEREAGQERKKGLQT